MVKNNHPFYCFKKNCRKTAWDTPEYLTHNDWNNLEYVIELVKKQDYVNFHKFVHTQNAREFFNHVIGWVEGYQYCQNQEYCEKTALPGLFQHDLLNMVKALKEHKKFAS